MSDATRAKVQRAIDELGLVRNESGRQLRAGQSRTIAYVMLDARLTSERRGAEWARDGH